MGLLRTCVPLRLLLPSPDYRMERGGSPKGCSHNDAILHRVVFPFLGVLFVLGFFLRHFSSTVDHQLQALRRPVTSDEAGQYLWGNLNHLGFFCFKKKCLWIHYSLYWFNSSCSLHIDLDCSPEVVSLEFFSFQSTIKRKKAPHLWITHRL